MTEVVVEAAPYHLHRASIQALRYAVFVEEQGVPVELEMDAHDATCIHVLAWREGRPIGTGRLLSDGHIGRVAVDRAWRGRGVGLAIMDKLIQLARARGYSHVALAAQVQAAGFYRRLGFQPLGSVYQEAGIDHVDMQLELV